MSEATPGIAPRRTVAFARYHRWDSDVSLIFAVLIWTGIAMGFSIDIARHYRTPHVAYPAIVWVHAGAYLGWPVVLTAQVLLIRAHRREVHRKLGLAAVALAAAMVVLGPTTAIAMQRAQLGTQESDPSFLAAQLLAIVAFATLATAAFTLRNNASAHKRLVLLATLAISDAGFARWLAGSLRLWLGSGFLPNVVENFAGSEVLLIMLGVYDLVTRRRLHPAYVAGAAWIVCLQLSAISLMRSSFWTPVALKLIGH